MNKVSKIFLPVLALTAVMGGGCADGVKINSRVGSDGIAFANVKRAYDNSKGLALPTSSSQFSTYYPSASYLGYGWGVTGGVATASNGTLSFDSTMTDCYNQLHSLITDNKAVGYVCFRFVYGVSANQGSTGVAYPGTDNFDDSFRVTDNYYSFITEVENVNTLDKCKAYIQSKASAIGSSCNGAFGVGFAIVNHENTLVDGAVKNLYYYVPNVPTITDILGNVTAVDLFGKDVPVVCSDVEKAHFTGKIGVCDVKVSASDSYGQTATATLRINIIDNGKPVVALKGGVSLSAIANRDTLKASDVPNFFDITDVGTKYGGTIGNPSYTFDGKALTDIAFKSDSVGTHSIGVSVSDSSGNNYTGSFAYVVNDGTAPVISRSDGGDMNSIIKIGLSRTFNLTKANFLALFNATDDVDGNITSKLVVDGDFIPNQVGKFNVRIKAVDNAGNTGSATVALDIIADIPPVFILSDNLVLATTSQKLTTAEMTSIVTNGILAGKEVSAVSVDMGNYVGNEDKVGSYTINYSASVSSGKSRAKMANGNNNIDGSFILKVSADTSSKEDGNTKHWYTPFVEFFQKLGNWFRGVFTKFKFNCFITNTEWDSRFSK